VKATHTPPLATRLEVCITENILARSQIDMQRCGAEFCGHGNPTVPRIIWTRENRLLLLLLGMDLGGTNGR
jgi:hypothetical protein